MRDSISGVQVKRAISPVSVADNTAQVSQIIDRQGYDSLSFIILLGSLADADATFAVTMDEGDASDLTGSNAVAAAEMVSQTSGTAALTAASFQFDSDNQVRKIGYLGNKRYVRLTITPSANASAGLMAACALLSRAEHKPVTQATA